MRPEYRYVSAREWRPQPGRQTKVLQRQEREMLVGGARFSTKTETGLAWGMEEKYINNPLFRGLVLRKNYEDLSDWISRARVFYDGCGRITGNPAEIKWPGGGVTRLGHWKEKDGIGKYLGHEYQKINIEEVNITINTLDEYLQLLSCCRSTIDDLFAQMYLSTNPGGPGHKWVKQYFVELARNKPYKDPRTGYWRIFIPMTVEDNPLGIKKDPEYYNWLKNLPEPLNSMWYKGSWDIMVGQHFPGFMNVPAIEPYKIGSRAHNRIFGSLDTGLGTNTSFGLWYKADDGHIERLCSYLQNGFTHAYHAEQIYKKIERMGEYIDGCFPVTIWVGHDVARKAKLNDQQPFRSPLDEYEEYFKDRGKRTNFIKVNPDKAHGCGIMQQAMSDENGTPILSYWKGFNESFEVSIQNAVTDPNDPEVYLKVKKFNPELKPFAKNLNVNDISMTGDVCDETMYGLCGMISDIAEARQTAKRYPSSRIIPFNNDEYMRENFSLREVAMG